MGVEAGSQGDELYLKVEFRLRAAGHHREFDHVLLSPVASVDLVVQPFLGKYETHHRLSISISVSPVTREFVNGKEAKIDGFCAYSSSASLHASCYHLEALVSTQKLSRPSTSLIPIGVYSLPTCVVINLGENLELCGEGTHKRGSGERTHKREFVIFSMETKKEQLLQTIPSLHSLGLPKETLNQSVMKLSSVFKATQPCRALPRGEAPRTQAMHEEQFQHSQDSSISEMKMQLAQVNEALIFPSGVPCSSRRLHHAGAAGAVPGISLVAWSRSVPASMAWRPLPMPAILWSGGHSPRIFLRHGAAISLFFSGRKLPPTSGLHGPALAPPRRRRLQGRCPGSCRLPVPAILGAGPRLSSGVKGPGGSGRSGPTCKLLPGCSCFSLQKALQVIPSSPSQGASPPQDSTSAFPPRQKKLRKDTTDS
ncbi:uncharacterized protein LOC115074749 [Rhinatrema bivittatum]|uniref:uncharacterized protein LOC115074749 n=1 Tax=Rhinatrema bivittatum TaxID=194408 RepID=UPI00112755BB|nr:uncharacterized protein LOC115074749 [Rhinatrema bivittatum]